MSSKVRLFKIASELNISKDTIVDFLLSRGFNVENKPTTTLDEDMQKLVYEKFKQERKNAENQREIIQKRKEKKAEQSAMDSGESPVVSDVAESSADNSVINKPEEANKEVIINDVSEFTKEEVFPKIISKIGIKNEVKEQNIQLEEDGKQKEKQNNSSKVNNKDAKEKKYNDNKDQKNQKSKKKSNDDKNRNKDYSRMLTTNLGDLIKNVDINLSEEDPSQLPSRIKAKMEAAKQILEEKKQRKNKKNLKNQHDNEEVQAENVSVEHIGDEDEQESGNIEPAITSSNDINNENIDKLEDVVEKESLETEQKIDEQGLNKEMRQPGDVMELKGLTVLGKINLASNNNASNKENRDKYHNAKQHGDNKNRDKKNKNKDNKDDKLGKDNSQKDKRKDKEFENKKNNKKDKDKKNRFNEIQTGEKKFISRDANKKHDNKENKEKRDNIDKEKRQDKKVSVYKDKSSNTTAPKVFSNAPAQPAKVKNAMYAEKKRKKGLSMKETLSDRDVIRKIRETLSGMEDNFTNAKKSKIKQQKKAIREEKEAKLLEITEHESHTLQLTEFVTTGDLANLMNVKPNEIILKCMQLGLMVTINQRLDKDTILLIASDYGFDVEFGSDEEIQEIESIEDREDDLLPRPPIVTIMGHVDHGKTSLLDHIRNANVVAGEAGGITQHIGAYRVILKNGKSITFLDTPGHEAFTAMRARGAQVTDIVVLVVAADDNVMPQTIEAISHARAANVPIVIAINKIDRPNANPDKIKQQLADQDVLVEDWGGTHQCVEISAKKGTNVDVLLDKILLEAEMLDLKANPDRNANGVIIESKMTKGWGNVATVVIQNGTLKVGDFFVAGANYGKTRAILDERGNKVLDVLPSQPAVVIGFDGLPEAGDTFNVIDSEIKAREIASHRKQLRREQEMRKVHHITLDDISEQISIGGVKELFLVLKADVAGSVEALSDSLLKLSTNEVRVNILHKSAGNITESDVMLAAASKAIIIGFNTSVSGQTIKLAETEHVEIRNYNIIYDCINEIQLALEGMLKPDIKEEVVGNVEVRKVFKIGRVGQIAGSYVIDGKVMRNDKVRVLRNGLPIFTGTLTSLKRNKDDVKEVEQGYECGIQIDGWNDFEENDIIEVYKLVEVKRSLSSN